MGKQVEVNQELCDKVFKLHEVGMQRKDIAKFMNVSRTTVDRIINFGFDAELMKKARRNIDAKRQAAKKMAEEPKAAETPAQISMDLEEEKKPTSYQEAMEQVKFEAEWDERDKKFMRFEAAQVDKICGRLDKIYDLLGQTLRRLDDGHTRNFKGPDQGETTAEEERHQY